MAKWILTIFVISSSPNISWTDLVYRRYAVFEIIVTRIFSHNSNLSFSSSLVSSCTPLLTMASYQETGMTKMAAVFFLMIIHYSSVISSLFIQARPGPVKTLLMIRSNKHWDPPDRSDLTRAGERAIWESERVLAGSKPVPYSSAI